MYQNSQISFLKALDSVQYFDSEFKRQVCTFLFKKMNIS